MADASHSAIQGAARGGRGRKLRPFPHSWRDGRYRGSSRRLPRAFRGRGHRHHSRNRRIEPWRAGARPAWRLVHPGRQRPRRQPSVRACASTTISMRAPSCAALRILDIPKTRFIAISKSGTTGETLAQTLTAFKFIEDAGHGALSRSCSSALPSRKSPAWPTACASCSPPAAFRCCRTARRSAAVIPPSRMLGLLPAMARGLDVAAFRAGRAGCGPSSS